MSECMLWATYIDKGGYGRKGSKLAHRWYYELIIGEIPKGLELDHLCKIPRCINIEHLEIVTRQENARRTRKTVCINGHKYTIDNTLFYKYKGKKYRRCRECARAALRRFFRAK